MTKIKLCTCEHAYQDAAHGKGKRVHNHASKSDAWRCTVCGRESKEKT